MSPMMIMAAIQAIESLTMMVAKLIQDHETLNGAEKQELIEKIKNIQASVPEWKK